MIRMVQKTNDKRRGIASEGNSKKEQDADQHRRGTMYWYAA